MRGSIGSRAPGDTRRIQKPRPSGWRACRNHGGNVRPHGLAGGYSCDGVQTEPVEGPSRRFGGRRASIVGNPAPVGQEFRLRHCRFGGPVSPSVQGCWVTGRLWVEGSAGWCVRHRIVHRGEWVPRNAVADRPRSGRGKQFAYASVANTGRRGPKEGRDPVGVRRRRTAGWDDPAVRGGCGRLKPCRGALPIGPDFSMGDRGKRVLGRPRSGFLSSRRGRRCHRDGFICLFRVPRCVRNLNFMCPAVPPNSLWVTGTASNRSAWGTRLPAGTEWSRRIGRWAVGNVGRTGTRPLCCRPAAVRVRPGPPGRYVDACRGLRGRPGPGPTGPRRGMAGSGACSRPSGGVSRRLKLAGMAGCAGSK